MVQHVEYSKCFIITINGVEPLKSVNHSYYTPGIYIILYIKWSEVKVIQLCLTLCDTMDYTVISVISYLKWSESCSVLSDLCDPMGYTVHGILQARILERVAFPFSRGSSQLRDWTQVSCIAGGFFTSWGTREAQEYWSG